MGNNFGNKLIIVIDQVQEVYIILMMYHTCTCTSTKTKIEMNTHTCMFNKWTGFIEKKI